MCKKCIYKQICKLIEAEMRKGAANTACYHFREIPPFPATSSEESYLV